MTDVGALGHSMEHVGAVRHARAVEPQPRAAIHLQPPSVAGGLQTCAETVRSMRHGQRRRGGGLRLGLAKDFVFLHRKFRSANFEPEPQISMKFRCSRHATRPQIFGNFDTPLNMGRHRSVGRSYAKTGKNPAKLRSCVLTPLFERLSWSHRFSWL